MPWDELSFFRSYSTIGQRVSEDCWMLHILNGLCISVWHATLGLRGFDIYGAWTACGKQEQYELRISLLCKRLKLLERVMLKV